MEYKATVVGNAVTDNDTDVDGDLLTAVPQTNVAGSHGGRFTLATDGTVTFDPHGDFEDLAVGEVRTTTLVYVVTDADGATDTATISVTVNGANDPPVATDDQVDTDAAHGVSGNVLGNDSDPDGDALVVTAVNGDSGAIGTTVLLPSGATVTMLADGSFDYSPNGAFDGLAAGQTAIDTFTYTIQDAQGVPATATVVVRIAGQNDPPVAVDDTVRTPMGTPVTISVLANDTDPNGDPLAVILLDPPANGTAVVNPDGTITFTPAPGFEGTTSFRYLAEDGRGGSTIATVTVEVYLPFAFDSFNNFSLRYGPILDAPWIVPQPMLSRQIFTLAPEPIFSGYARPGARIVGRIYDETGALQGEAFASADPGGNWMMHFSGLRRCAEYRVEFTFALESNDLYGYLGLNPSDDSYQAMQPLTAWDEALGVNGAMRGVPSRVLQRMTREDAQPLGIGTADAR
ncbi:MAG: cadherin-like domain-containing protein [Pirellulales bacterium]